MVRETISTAPKPGLHHRSGIETDQQEVPPIPSGDPRQSWGAGHSSEGQPWRSQLPALRRPVGRSDCPLNGDGVQDQENPLAPGRSRDGRGCLGGGVCSCSAHARPFFPLSPADFRDLYTKVLEEEAASISSADTGQARGGRLEGVAPRVACKHSPAHSSFSSLQGSALKPAFSAWPAALPPSCCVPARLRNAAQCPPSRRFPCLQVLRLPTL